MPEETLSDNIIAMLQVQALPFAERKDLVDKATEVVLARVRERLIEELPEEALEPITAAMEAEDLEAIGTILDQHQVDLAIILEEEVDDIKLLLGNIKQPTV